MKFIKHLFLLAAILSTAGCSTSFSTLNPEGANEQVLYAIPEARALQIAHDSIVVTLPGRKIQEVNGPIRGFTTYFRFMLDTYSQKVFVFAAKGTDKSGGNARGYYFEVSGSGTSIVQGRNKNYQLFDKVVEFAEATGKRVAVTDVERIPYTNAARKLTGTDIADQLRKIKELQDEGVITEAEFETMKKELLTRMRGQTDPSR